MTDSEARAPRVVAVVGSPRPHGNTAAVAAAVTEELERLGVPCETIVLADHRLPGCEGHEDCADYARCVQDDDAQRVLDKVYAAEGLVLATPVYYEDVSAQMKAFIDRNYWQYTHDIWLSSRVVGLIAVAAETGIEETLDTLRRYVALSSKEPLPLETLACLASDMGDAAADVGLLENARDFARRLAQRLR